MDPELLNTLLDAGGTGILVWMLLDMRKEAAAQRLQTWALLEYLIRQRDPDFSAQSLSRTAEQPRSGNP